jgi:hypothetical protein
MDLGLWIFACLVKIDLLVKRGAINYREGESNLYVRMYQNNLLEW